tara:strand:- start:87 stop:488 length:402 start_codon:yes stop_codon:yes gene_type:complete
VKFERIYAEGVPEPGPGMWSNCKRSGDLVFISGLVAVSAEGEVIAPTDAYEQACCIFSYIQKHLEAAGGCMNDLAKMTIFLTDIRDRPAVLEARKKFFSDDFPCSTLIEVDALIDPRMLVEIEGMAVLGAGKN